MRGFPSGLCLHWTHWPCIGRLIKAVHISKSRPTGRTKRGRHPCPGQPGAERERDCARQVSNPQKRPPLSHISA